MIDTAAGSVLLLCTWLLLLIHSQCSTIHALENKQADDYNVDYTIYHTYTRLQDELHTLANNTINQPILQLHRSPYTTASGHTIEYYTLTDLSSSLVSNTYGASKLHILITCGEHARELITVESCLDLIVNITHGYHQPCHTYEHTLSSFILSTYILTIVPLLNIDGKLHMEHSADMCWRNNYPAGVDVNRNTAWQWGGEGSSNITGNEELRGEHAFDQPESQFVRWLVTHTSYTAYMSVHSGEKQLFVPFVDTVSKHMKRIRASTTRELAVASHIIHRTAGWYRNYGIAYEYNSYGADGTLMDYVAGIHHVPYVYTVEIYGPTAGHPNCFVHFNSKPSELKSDLQQIRMTYIGMLEQIAQIELNVRAPRYDDMHDDDMFGVSMCKIQRSMISLRWRIRKQYNIQR